MTEIKLMSGETPPWTERAADFAMWQSDEMAHWRTRQHGPDGLTIAVRDRLTLRSFERPGDPVAATEAITLIEFENQAVAMHYIRVVATECALRKLEEKEPRTSTT